MTFRTVFSWTARQFRSETVGKLKLNFVKSLKSWKEISFKVNTRVNCCHLLRAKYKIHQVSTNTQEEIKQICFKKTWEIPVECVGGTVGAVGDGWTSVDGSSTSSVHPAGCLRCKHQIWTHEIFQKAFGKIDSHKMCPSSEHVWAGIRLSIGMKIWCKLGEKRSSFGKKHSGLAFALSATHEWRGGGWGMPHIWPFKPYALPFQPHIWPQANLAPKWIGCTSPGLTYI